MAELTFQFFPWKTFLELALHILVFLPIRLLSAFIYRHHPFQQRVCFIVKQQQQRVDPPNETRVETRRILWQRQRADYPDPMRVRVHSHMGYKDASTFLWNDPYTHVQHLTKDGVVIVRTSEGEHT